MKLNRQLSGIAGEYYVAAELSRRGYLAAITLRNSDGADILVSNLDESKLFSIQVKTTQNKLKWILSQKVENETSENKFFVFTNIPSNIDEKPIFKIVKAIDLAEYIRLSHKNWLEKTIIICNFLN